MSGRDPWLILFDMDGTLIDTQQMIVAALSDAFGELPGDPPEPAAIREVLGMSLGEAVMTLRPDARPSEIAKVVERYRAALIEARVDGAAANQPLFPGAEETLRALAARPDLLLGIATGKSRSGLRAVLAARDLGRLFVTCQTVDDHASKPHPSMVNAAMAETGTPSRRTVMVGDSVQDMQMAAAAGATAIGVAWGQDRPEALAEAGAVAVVERFADLPAWIDDLAERTS